MMSPRQRRLEDHRLQQLQGQGRPVQRGRARGHRARGADHLGAERHPQRGRADRRRLTAVARALAYGVLNPAVVQLRRLAIAEALRFPGIVTAYWERAPARTLALLTESFTQLAARGELDIDDPSAAAAFSPTPSWACTRTRPCCSRTASPAGPTSTSTSARWSPRSCGPTRCPRLSPWLLTGWQLGSALANTRHHRHPYNLLGNAQVGDTVVQKLLSAATPFSHLDLVDMIG